MANYCNAEDVSVLLGFDNFSTTTRPTLAQVNSIIADVTNEIDFALAAEGITTQPTDSRILGRLSIACKFGVACQVGMSAFGNATGVENTQPDIYCTRYHEILTEISDKPEMYGAVTGDAVIFSANQVTDGTWTESATKNRYIEENYEV